MKSLIAGIIVIALIVLGVWYVRQDRVDYTPTPQNNNINATTTFPVFGTLASSSEIVIDFPKVGDKITSPMTVRGRARGPWYFEASAPVTVIDSTGKIIGQSYVMAVGEWMTTEFVPFEGTIRFDNVNNTEGGAVIFMNDNPSGEPSRSKYYAIPVFFK